MSAAEWGLLWVLIGGTAFAPLLVPLTWLAAFLASPSRRHRRRVTGLAVLSGLLLMALWGLVWWFSFEPSPGNSEPGWVTPTVVVLFCAVALSVLTLLATAIVTIAVRLCQRHNGLRTST